jgi:TonB family protein
MADTAQHLLGQIVDGRFPLRKLLGVSPDSAVFLTDLENQRPSESAPEAAIKLIPEDPETSDRQLARWKAASALAHPGLLRILHFGRCTVDDSPCLYVVTELASENLGELLRQRPLSSDETTGLLTPVLGALAFLHENGLVHAGLKPSNILALGEKIKLAPDRILPARESASPRPLAGPYLAPEPVLTDSSDVWSLGVSLYEALTQYLPVRDSAGRYVLPQLASPFSEIVRGALLEDPAERMTLDDIRSRLDPTFVSKPKPAPEVRNEPVETSRPAAPPEPEAAPQAMAAAAPASAPRPARSAEPPAAERIDPLSVPLSPVSPKAAPARIPVSSLPNVNVTIAAPRRPAEPRARRGSFKYFLIGAAATLLLAALVVPRLLRNGPNSSAAAPGISGETRASGNPPAAPADTAPPAASASPAPVESPAPVKEKAAAAVPAAPARTAPAAPPARSSVSEGTPEVSHRVIPEASDRARNTIHGTVRIGVRVQINSDGTVSSADLDSPVASQYFSDLALKAARQWRFVPSGSSSALLRFDFTNSAATASVIR